MQKKKRNLMQGKIRELYADPVHQSDKDVFSNHIFLLTNEIIIIRNEVKDKN